MKDLWLKYEKIDEEDAKKFLTSMKINFSNINVDVGIEEINIALKKINSNLELEITNSDDASINLYNDDTIYRDGYKIVVSNKIKIYSNSTLGFTYSIFDLLAMLNKKELKDLEYSDYKKFRMINHWDNLDGTIERGYAGESIFYKDGELVEDISRIHKYARILSSMKINYITVNNVNADKLATEFLTTKKDVLKSLYDIFTKYGIKVMMSLNFAAPITLEELTTCDPLEQSVVKWWEIKLEQFFNDFPKFGGFLIKADSEGRPGPFKYGRTHADGANVIANIIEKWDAIVMWRCFVYNCEQDWRDQTIDRAKAVYSNFIGLDGKFAKNVYLQVKNGPIDFQVREPITPLFGAMKNTNLILELQITQEYTGQQLHVCNLTEQWNEIMHTNTGYDNKEVIDTVVGVAAVVNVGNDLNWTGHFLAQSNLYAYGKLTSYKNLNTCNIIKSWVDETFDLLKEDKNKISGMLTTSWSTYEKYTAPLGIGFMVEPHYHYGPNVDGYEYSRWGTYHKSTSTHIGYDRTEKKGSGYTAQYAVLLKDKYENLDTCPDNLKLFFHRLSYDYILISGKTVIQHIYDSHFEGVEEVEDYIKLWDTLQGKVEKEAFESVKERLNIQVESAKEWRDRINTYYHRISSIEDGLGRKIYD